MQEIFRFLTDIAANNTRQWFAENRSRYDAAAAKFTTVAADIIGRVARLEPAVTGLPVKSTLYRFYRDTRFSPDKSPFKRHFGCYINPHGKKSFHGGYYLHLEPDASMVAVGTYCLPADALRAVRTSIVAETERFRGIMTEPELAALCPRLGETWLKTTPKGFPRDFPYPEYLRPREYDLSVMLPDEFFFRKGWQDEAVHLFALMKPFLDFVNETVDDYI